MSTERVPLTPEGKERLEKELKQLKGIERPKVIKAIEEARAHGDLSENAEYHAAKDQQGHLEARIRDLEDQQGRAEVIPLPTEVPARVVFGVKVTAVDVDTEKAITFRIVGEYEADPENDLLSVNAPMVRAFIGKELGDEVLVRSPGGVRSFEITDLTI